MSGAALVKTGELFMGNRKFDERRTKLDRTLSIFLRGLKGEKLTAGKLADEYGVTIKSIQRTVDDIRAFLLDNRELVGNSEFVYDRSEKCYILKMEGFLQDKELLAIIKILIGSRAFSKRDLLNLILKLKKLVSTKGRELLKGLIQKEKYHYCEVKSDCESVIDNLWQLAGSIKARREITITYCKTDRERVSLRICPLSILFSENYFYLVSYKAEEKDYNPVYFRVDSITDIAEHRTLFKLDRKQDLSDGELRERMRLMSEGKPGKIRFEFSGSSCRELLNRLPYAVITGKSGDNFIIEAENYDSEIKALLLSQGSRVKALAPQEFVAEMREEAERMRKLYQ